MKTSDDCKFYTKWIDSKRRCEDKTRRSYPSYGGRGIKHEWPTFQMFCTDMRQSYLEHVAIHGERQTTLDRIDSNGNYSKENCRWATYGVQTRNRSNSVVHEYMGIRMNEADWARESGMTLDAFNKRVRKWGFQQALTTPYTSRSSPRTKA